MPQILIIFGSKSDSEVYNKIEKQLEKDKITYKTAICSAHRNPEELDKLIKETDAKLIIAGAGLAAHLPGVIASKTTKPVIGVPVNANFEGVDSLLSIMQMPGGIPVLCTAVNGGNSLKKIKLILSPPHRVYIKGGKNNKRVQKCIEMLNNFEIKYGFSDSFDPNDVNINFFDLNKGPDDNENCLIINVPILEKSKADDALLLKTR